MTQRINAGNTVNFTYDSDSYLTGAGALIVNRLPANGLIGSRQLGSLTETYAYNTHGELTAQSLSFGATVLYALQLTRDAGGRVTHKTETISGATSNYDYTYDMAGRLIGVLKNGSVATSYTYDANSVRTSYAGPLGSVPAAQITIDGQDRVLQYGTSTFAYSAHGDLQTKTVGAAVTQYVYDEMDNLVTVTLPTATTLDYLIDGANRRVAKRVGGIVQHRWLYDSQVRIAAALDAAGSVTRRFVYGTRPNVPDYYVEAGANVLVATDHLGSPRLLVNAATGAILGQMDHDEFGRVLTDTASSIIPFGYAGGLYDPDTGLVRFGARDYDPTLGRWTTRDRGTQRMRATLYEYAHSSPLSFVDPMGYKGISFEPEIPGFPKPTDIIRDWDKHHGPFADPEFARQNAWLVKSIKNQLKALDSEKEKLKQLEQQYKDMMKACPPEPSKAQFDRLEKLKNQIRAQQRRIDNINWDLARLSAEYARRTALLAGDALLPTGLDIYDHAKDWASAPYWGGKGAGTLLK